MSEPAGISEALDPNRSVLHWSVWDDRIDWRSDAYALPSTDDATVLVDPLPLAGPMLRSMKPVSAIVLTIQSHQRSAWRCRQRFGAPVWAPRRAEGLEEEPDRWYDDGDRLPGGLLAVHAPGPCDASFVLLHGDGPGLFLGDLLVEEEDGDLGFVDDEYMDDPRRARESVRRLLDLEWPIVALYPGHGAPRTSGAKAALRRALARDRL